MYKIIDLGHEVPETGEARVSLHRPFPCQNSV